MRKRLNARVKEVLICAGVFVLVASGRSICAQATAPQVPYASMKGASYAGPGREASYDLKGTAVHIGLIAPLHGPQKAEGEAIVAAARLAIEDVSKSPLSGGRRMELAVGDESGPSWGHAANALINLVFEQDAVAVITSASGDVTHLSEQVGNRLGVPILTLSSDATTTQIDLPWIFRLGPSDDVQAGMIAQDIYRRCGFQHVVLVSAQDHDGRVGSNAFESAARSLGAPKLVSAQLNPRQPDYDSLLSLIKAHSPQAVVIWTRSHTAREVMREFREAGLKTAVYLSQQASQDFSTSGESATSASAAESAGNSALWTLDSESAHSARRESFVRRYQAATGRAPSPTAAQAYDAVLLVANALQKAGPNRARVRDQVAHARDFSGVSGMISFDPQGNNRAGVQLVHVQ